MKWTCLHYSHDTEMRYLSRVAGSLGRLVNKRSTFKWLIPSVHVARDIFGLPLKTDSEASLLRMLAFLSPRLDYGNSATSFCEQSFVLGLSGDVDVLPWFFKPNLVILMLRRYKWGFLCVLVCFDIIDVNKNCKQNFWVYSFVNALAKFKMPFWYLLLQYSN